jgi:hypothetical protein
MRLSDIDAMQRAKHEYLVLRRKYSAMQKSPAMLIRAGDVIIVDGKEGSAELRSSIGDALVAVLAHHLDLAKTKLMLFGVQEFDTEF